MGELSGVLSLLPVNPSQCSLVQVINTNVTYFLYCRSCLYDRHDLYLPSIPASLQTLGRGECVAASAPSSHGLRIISPLTAYLKLSHYPTHPHALRYGSSRRKILFRNGNLTLALAVWWQRLWSGSGCGGSRRAPGWCGWAVASLLWRCCGGAVCCRPAISLPTQSVVVGELAVVSSADCLYAVELCRGCHCTR